MQFSQFTTLLKMNRAQIDRLITMSLRMLTVVGVAYACAAVLSSWMVSFLLTEEERPTGRRGKQGRQIQATVAQVNIKRPNHRNIRRAILDRNLFNSEGVFPDEREAVTDEEPVEQSSFDLNAPCSKSTLKLELIGTIMVTGGNSIATVKEQGFSPDIYREGDPVIENEQASIVKIERNRVILNNGGKKECLELEEAPKNTQDDGFPDVSGYQPSNEPSRTDNEPPPAAGGDCALQESYVRDQLGDGFSKIITKARLVPNTGGDNQMNGFKIFNIERDSLFMRAGFKNGDIITEVNEVSLKQPEQGFALYQAFQDDREVRINILRKGQTPMVITCRIQ